MIDHERARQTLYGFCDEWGTTASESLYADLLALLKNLGLVTEPISITAPPVCEYCARSKDRLSRDGIAGMWHYDLGEWAICPASSVTP